MSVEPGNGGWPRHAYCMNCRWVRMPIPGIPASDILCTHELSRTFVGTFRLASKMRAEVAGHCGPDGLLYQRKTQKPPRRRFIAWLLGR